MNNQTDGVTTTIEKGWDAKIVWGVFATVGAAGGVLLVARMWVVGVYKDLGPERSADVTMITGIGSCLGGMFMLLVVGIAAYFWTRVVRSTHAPAPSQATGYLPDPELPAGIPRTGTPARLPSGSTFQTKRVPSVTLHFADGRSASVPKHMVRTALNADTLKQATWPHGKTYYTPIRAYLDEQNALSETGEVDRKVADRMLRYLDDAR